MTPDTPLALDMPSMGDDEHENESGSFLARCARVKAGGALRFKGSQKMRLAEMMFEA